MPEMTLKGFLKRFKQIVENDPSRRFCFILGAGASMSSGIPGARYLVLSWLKEIYDTTHAAESITFDEWMLEGKHGIPNYKPKDPGASYSEVFKERFWPDFKEGTRYLEKLMEFKKPSLGYYVLADILNQNKHNLVITVNFDNLIADALFFYSGSHPILCGHNNVAALMPTVPHRPMVIKVHHDIYLNPLSDPDSLTKIGPGFKKKLPEFLKSYTPIVIGYGGNDGSLMKVLHDCKEISGGIYWCLRDADPIPDVVEDLLVKQKKGTIVRIPDFDSFMVQFGAEQDRKFDLNENELKAAYADNLQRVIKQRDDFALGADAETAEALESPSPKGDKKPWWHYQRLADMAGDIDRKEAIFREAIVELPYSHELLGNYALFLTDIRKDLNRAEEMYKRAIEANPKQANHLGNYAGLLFGLGRIEASEIVNRYDNVRVGEPNSATIEVAFYRYANDSDDNRFAALKEIIALLGKGIHSENWDFSLNIERAKLQKHPEIKWLPKLAAVINNEASVEILKDWPAWKEASKA
jgi:protein O-mannosyl-transferase